MGEIDIIYAITFGSMIILFSFLFINMKKDKEASKAFIENHKKLHPGMTKAQVLDIMGEKYTKSILQNGVEKLEWKHRQSGYSGRISKGAYVHTSSFTRKISVKFKDDVVIEVHCLNMD